MQQFFLLKYDWFRYLLRTPDVTPQVEQALRAFMATAFPEDVPVGSPEQIKCFSAAYTSGRLFDTLLSLCRTKDVLQQREFSFPGVNITVGTQPLNRLSISFPYVANPDGDDFIPTNESRNDNWRLYIELLWNYDPVDRMSVHLIGRNIADRFPMYALPVNDFTRQAMQYIHLSLTHALHTSA